MSNTINFLPPEILSTIFLLCDKKSDGYANFWGFESDQVFCRPDPHTSPLLVSQVCSHWRKVAFNTGDLWACLSIGWTKKNAVHQQKLCQVWLQRAGNHRLALRMYERFYSLPGTSMWDRIRDECAEEIASAILPFRSNLEELYINSDFSKFLLIMDNTEFPVLKSLVPDHARDTGMDPGILQYLNAPHLERIKIPFALSSLVSISHLPLNGITHLSFSSTKRVQPSTALEILRQCTSLIYFEPALSNTPTTGPLPPLTASLLRHLSIVAECDILALFLDALTLPSLTHFRFPDGHRNTFDGPSFTLHPLSALFERSSPCQVQRICINSMSTDFSDSDMIRLLSSTPQLLYLDVALKWQGDSLLGDTFAHKLACSEIVPVLEELHFDFLTNITYTAVQEILDKRPGLKKVELCYANYEEDEELQAIVGVSNWRFSVIDGSWN